MFLGQTASGRHVEEEREREIDGELKEVEEVEEEIDSVRTFRLVYVYV